MEKILERVRAKFSALSKEELISVLESVSDHPVVKAMDVILQAEDLISEYESFHAFMRNSNFYTEIDWGMEFEELIGVADFFAANESNFLLAA